VDIKIESEKHWWQSMILIDDFRGWKPGEYLWLVVAVTAIALVSASTGSSLLLFVSSIANVVCVILVAQGKISNYAWGLVGSVAYAMVAYQWGYFGDSMLNALYYAPMQVIGVLMWRQKMVESNKPSPEVSKKSLTWNQLRFVGAIVACAILLFGLWLLSIGGKLPLMDSASTVLSVTAMIFMALRLREQWLLWILVNLISIGMWSVAYMNDQTGAVVLVMWLVFLANSVWGWMKWRGISSN